MSRLNSGSDSTDAKPRWKQSASVDDEPQLRMLGKPVPVRSGYDVDTAGLISTLERIARSIQPYPHGGINE